MSKGLSYLFKKTIGQLKIVMSRNKFLVHLLIKEIKRRNKTFDQFPLNLSEGHQGKHIVGHNNYKEGRSILTMSMKEAQLLVRSYSGLGEQISNCKERVDFHRPIGKYINQSTGETLTTTVGIIHYSKNGAHIVPAQPKTR